jgi:hypothetical protein
MDNVWVRGEDNTMIRADAIVVLENGPSDLRAECVTGRTVKLTASECSSSFQLRLLEEIRHASWDDRRTVVIMVTGDRDSPTWHRESVDTLIDQLSEHSRQPRNRPQLLR